MSKYDVFISYRREGGLDCARTLFTELERRGFRCFFDFKELKTGKFTDGIQQAVRNCRYFVLVLTDGSLDRCMSDADDWVRREIELALSLGKPIVPVCPSGNRRGFPEGLPESLSALQSIQISQLARDDLFDASMNAIVKDRLSSSKIVSVRRRLPFLAIVATVVLTVVALGVISRMHRRAQERAEAAEIEAQAVRQKADAKVRQEKAALEQAEKLKREAEVARLEIERRAKAAAERAAAEKARLEAERLAAEKAKAAAEEKAKREAERMAKVEAERLAAERARQEAVEKARLAEAKARADAEAKAAAERKRKMSVFDNL